MQNENAEALFKGGGGDAVKSAETKQLPFFRILPLHSLWCFPWYLKSCSLGQRIPAG